MTWAEHIIQYYKDLRPPKPLPEEIEWLHPQLNNEVMDVVNQFYTKYYSDHNVRTIILGINPGRYGAGVTGVNFTAPRQLKQVCKIQHSFKDQSELSAEFIYEMINAYGSPEQFYQDFFIGSVCPLGFIQNGKNLNYYDNKELLHAVEPFIISSMNKLLDLPYNKDVVFCIGGEKNYKYLNKINQQHKWFKTIEILHHPRYIMQYKRKTKDRYIDDYIKLLRKK
jgi:hypothetical protein